MAGDSRDGGFLFAVAESGGLYRSTNGGQSWHSVQAGLPTFNVLTVVTAEDTKTVYAGLRYDLADDGLTLAAGGLFRSTNGGDTWTALLSESVRSIALDPLAPGRITVAIDTDSGNGTRVLVSDDSGNSWADVGAATLPASQNTHLLKLDRAAPRRAFVTMSGGQGLYRSIDGGPWTAIGPEESLENFFVDGPTIYAATSIGMQRSTDDGATWTSSTLPIGRSITPHPTSPGSLLFFGFNGHVSEAHPDGGTQALWVLPHRLQAAHVDPSGTMWLGALGDGIHRLELDGGTSPHSTGLTATIVGELLYSHVDHQLYAATTSGLFTSIDGGAWSRLRDGYFNRVSLNRSGNTLFVLGQWGAERFVGGSWSTVSTGYGMYDIGGTSNGMTLVADHGGIARSTAVSFTRATGVATPVRDLWVPTDGGVLWAANGSPLFSTDDGLSWSADAGTAAMEGFVFSVSVDPTDQRRVRAGNHLSTNGGVSWELLPLCSVSASAFAAAGDLYVACGSRQVFYRTSSGAFIDLDVRLRTNPLTLAAHPADPGLVCLGTSGRGVWCRRASP